MCLHIGSFKSTAANKKWLFPSLFLILSEAFRNDHVAACSTAIRSAAEKNGKGGYVTVPCLSKKTQRSSTVEWLKF